ncbi:MAG: DUF4230 domain-containing protein [Bacteroidota bacterium]
MKKYWFIFLLIIVYILIAGLNILPRNLNVFKKKRLLINETPVVVKEIREIGELTTSEFYGEVYADLNEVYSEIIVEYGDSLKFNPTAFYEKYPGLEKYRKDARNFRAKEIFFEKESERYELFLTEYYQKLDYYREQKVELGKEINAANSNSEKKKLEKRLSDLKEEMIEEKVSFVSRKEKFNETEEKIREQKNSFRDERKRRNLVYIGRGWVKAGIDLKGLTEEDIFIDDSDSLYIHVLIPEPETLEVDINPWFVYTEKKKIKGFELFIAKTGSLLSSDNFTDMEISAVKHKCKVRLEQEAIEKGLLNNAKSSALTTLENFFHLLGFEKVKINFKTGDHQVVSKY